LLFFAPRLKILAGQQSMTHKSKNAAKQEYAIKFKPNTDNLQIVSI